MLNTELMSDKVGETLLSGVLWRFNEKCTLLHSSSSSSSSSKYFIIMVAIKKG